MPEPVMPRPVAPDLRVGAPAGAEPVEAGETAEAGEAAESHDPLGPPRTPVEVGCLHCGQVYRSDRIWFDERGDGPAGPGGRRGFWACGTAGCDGIGFAFDIWPTDPEYRDEQTGEKYWVDDAGGGGGRGGRRRPLRRLGRAGGNRGRGDPVLIGPSRGGVACGTATVREPAP